MDDRWKSMRLRYAGTCSSCGTGVAAGERGHYDREAKVVRCGTCGLPDAGLPDAGLPDAGLPDAGLPDAGLPDAGLPTTGAVGPREASAGGPGPTPTRDSAAAGASGAARPARAGTPRPRTRPSVPSCEDCGRPLQGHDVVSSDDGTTFPVCAECVQLDLLHVVGVPGGGARQEHARRVQRRETRVRTRHPRLGGLILALAEEPQHTTAWKTGAVGEEEFGRRLSGIAGEGLKVLHDRKRPGSSANIDHLAVTSQGVLVIDAKKHQGKIETRGHGLFSRQEPDLFVGSRNQTSSVLGVLSQVEAVRAVLDGWARRTGSGPVPVSGALVFVEGEFGLFASPLRVRGVDVLWGRRLRADLAARTGGEVPVAQVAKHLAVAFRRGVRPDA